MAARKQNGEEEGLLSVSLLPACVCRKTVFPAATSVIPKTHNFSCGFVSVFEKEQLDHSTLQYELGEGVYCLFLLLHLHRHRPFSAFSSYQISHLHTSCTLFSHFQQRSMAVAGGQRNINSMPYNRKCLAFELHWLQYGLGGLGTICPFIPPVTVPAASLEVLSKSQF